ncbi:TIR domain-containing protein [Methylogaea oryzae]|uniref:TIR domain-containing protein n=1 Tax=Methylogaea oryzae TaxID=1295382 RepID=UPI0009EBC79D|nr:TIR domain-containing protein [Methylogaea oryzae]
MAYTGTKRRVFISHYKGDRVEVNAFIDHFATKHEVFTPYILGAGDNYDFINSNDPAYVMTQIRKKYLQDTTITIILVGNCTHSRRYVDWEIKSSLQQGETLPNGLMGIILPSKGGSAHLPPRIKDNWNKEGKDCYARYCISKDTRGTRGWIEDAYAARTARSKFIQNSQDMMKYNAKCLVCVVTH